MEIRGHRECQSCGTRWSYYETGQIACPSCGSVRSVGLDDPTEHTAGPAELDLSPVRNQLEDQPLREVADSAVEVTREYVSAVGFVSAGELQPLDDTYLAAMELRRVASTVGRLLDVEDDEELYVLSLLHGADSGERPNPEEVPEVFHPERGLAVAASVDVYTSDIRRVVDGHTPTIDKVLSSVDTRRKRIEALDGDVDPTESERLVRALRDLRVAVGERADSDASQEATGNAEAALARALERFE